MASNFWYTADSTSTATATVSVERPWTTWVDDNDTTTWTANWGATAAITPSTSTAVPWRWRQRTESPEEREQRKTREKEEAKRRTEAQQVSEKLLQECLSPDQKAEYERNKRFHVVSKGGNRYEIDCEKLQHNVHRLDQQGKRVENLCAHQIGGLPLADNALAQKLMLETEEQRFREIANIRRMA